MDLYCRNCAEPWDNDSLHEEAEARGSSYPAIAAEFREKGCSALHTAFGSACSDREVAVVVGVLTDLLGDDMDGLASMLDAAEVDLT